MKTTKFGSKIIEAAEEILQLEYRAGDRNYYGEKLEQVVQEFDLLQSVKSKVFKGRGKAQPDYCAITISVILDRAMRKYNGSDNTLRNVSAKYFIDESSRRELRIDNRPQPGCIFATQRSGGTGWHVSIV